MTDKSDPDPKEKYVGQIKPLSQALMEQRKNFYMVVGQALSHWVGMEVRLIQIAAILLRTDSERAGIVMYPAPFGSWVPLIDDLFKHSGTYPEAHSAWNKLSNKLRGKNDIRVRLAHQSLSQEGDSAGYQAYLRPSEFDRRQKTIASKPMTIVEILKFADDVGELHDELVKILRLMKKRESSLRIFRAQLSRRRYGRDKRRSRTPKAPPAPPSLFLGLFQFLWRRLIAGLNEVRSWRTSRTGLSI